MYGEGSKYIPRKGDSKYTARRGILNILHGGGGGSKYFARRGSLNIFARRVGATIYRTEGGLNILHRGGLNILHGGVV